jgi:hypothetical protein
VELSRSRQLPDRRPLCYITFACRISSTSTEILTSLYIAEGSLDTRDHEVPNGKLHV